MLGLQAYETSSDEEDNISHPATNAKEEQTTSFRPRVSSPLVGPFQQVEQTEQSPSFEDASKIPRELSPFTSQRSLIRDMTLPPHPNLEIPPSPPGSPSPNSNQKFVHFLSLKKKGIHFNEKLASSSSLKNPSLLSSLMQHVGLKETSQYATSLSTDIWDPTNLPRWAYKEELQKMQQEFRRKTEEEKTSTTARDTIEFVQGSHETSRTGNPGQKAPRRGNNWA